MHTQKMQKYLFINLMFPHLTSPINIYDTSNSGFNFLIKFHSSIDTSDR